MRPRNNSWTSVIAAGLDVGKTCGCVQGKKRGTHKVGKEFNYLTLFLLAQSFFGLIEVSSPDNNIPQ